MNLIIDLSSVKLEKKVSAAQTDVNGDNKYTHTHKEIYIPYS
jgi:hypothetical protein